MKFSLIWSLEYFLFGFKAAENIILKLDFEFFGALVFESIFIQVIKVESINWFQSSLGFIDIIILNQCSSLE